MSELEDLLRSPLVRRAAAEVVNAVRPAVESLLRDDAAAEKPPSQAERKARLIVDLNRAAVASVLDTEVGHQMADKALLEYVDDVDVEEVWARVKRWYG